MTAPRQILPGTTYLVTRRCAQRQFLLTPSTRTNSLFLYLLAVAAKRHGILIHALCVLSNHYHLVVTDPGARLPAFQQYLHSLVARALNAALGHWESFWAPSSAKSVVVLASPEDVLDKAAYTLANPVAAGLVRSGRAWPGLWSAPEWIGSGPIRLERPDAFFRPDGPMPDTVELELTAPPGFASAAEFREQLEAALAVRERDDAARIEATRGPQPAFLGRRRVLAQEPTAAPPRIEPRRGLNPRVAARDKRKRIEVLAQMREFADSYRSAWRARREGRRDVVFPAGTYLLRIAHGVPCAAFT